MFGYDETDWIAKEQRRSLRGRGPLEKFQGLIAPTILISRSDMESAPEDTVQANVEFANTMMNEGAFLPGEFSPNSFYSYYADYYLAQVLNGGHAQYAHNCGWNPMVVRAAGFGLYKMGAPQHLAILERFAAIVNGRDSKRARAILEGGGFGKVDAEVEALDGAFFQLETRAPLAPLNAAWLKSLPELSVARDDYGAVLAQLCDANPLRAARQAEAKRRTEAFMAADPLHRTVRKLCAKGGCAYDGLTAGAVVSNHAPYGWMWGVKTDIGVCYAIFREHRRLFGRSYDVVLTASDPEKQALAGMKITRKAYEAIVPRQVREG